VYCRYYAMLTKQLHPCRPIRHQFQGFVLDLQVFWVSHLRNSQRRRQLRHGVCRPVVLAGRHCVQARGNMEGLSAGRHVVVCDSLLHGHDLRSGGSRPRPAHHPQVPYSVLQWAAEICSELSCVAVCCSASCNVIMILWVCVMILWIRARHLQ